MADVTSKAIIDVQAKTDDAMRGFQRLADAIGQVGERVAGSNVSIEGMFNKVRDGVDKFQSGLGQVQQVLSVLNAAVDAATADQRRENMEKLLPSGVVDRFRESVDNLISRNDVLRLSVKGMTGDFKLTDDQMQIVLKTSVALSQRTGETAEVISDKLIDALAKGVNKLDDYGINLDKTKDRQADVNAAMGKFQEIISDTPIDEQTKSMGELKDNLNQVALAIQNIAVVFAQTLGSIAKDWNEYAPDFVHLFGGSTEQEKRAIADRARAEETARLRGRQVDSGAGIYLDREDLTGRSRRPYLETRAGQSEAERIMAEYEAKYGGKEDTTALNGPKRGDGSVPVYVINAREVGEHTVYGRDNVQTLSATALEAANAGPTLRSPNAYGRGGRDFDNPTYGGYQGSRPYYDPSNPSASFGTAMHERGQFAGGAYDVANEAAMAGIEAMITGQKAVGRAIIEASQAALRAKAIEWGAFALGELAWAIADPVGAAAHLAAAAKFGAAAAAAGLGAAALGALAGGGGSGGSSGVSAAGGGYASGGLGAPANSGGGTVIVNIGEGFYGDSEKVAEAVGRAVRQAQRQGQRSDYSSKFSG